MTLPPIASRCVIAIAFALPALAHAQTIYDTSGKPEEFERAHKEMLGTCSSEGTLTGRSVSEVMGTRIVVESIHKKTSWTGGCVDGKADGEGIVRFTSEIVSTSGGVAAGSQSSSESFEGTMVRGKFVGLIHIKRQTLVGQFDFYAFSEGAMPGNFSKLSDGRFQQLIGRKPMPGKEPVAEAEFTELSRRLIAAERAKAGTAAGKADQPVLSVKALEDLLPGGKIVIAADRRIKEPKTKAVAIVMSAPTQNEIARYTAYLGAMQAAVKSLPEVKDASGVVLTRDERMRFLTGIAAPKLVEQALIPFASTFKSVTVVADLAEFQDKKLDHAFILDLTFPSESSPSRGEIHLLDSKLRYMGSFTSYIPFYQTPFEKWRDPTLNRFQLGFENHAVRSEAPLKFGLLERIASDMTRGIASIMDR